MIIDPTAVFFVLAAVVAVAVGMEEHFKAARALGSALVAILLGMLLSNLGVIPGESTAYQFLGGPGVYAGIILILLNVNIKSVIDAGPSMLVAFGLGAIGAAAGATVAALLLVDSIGPETWKLAGQYAGTYTGGGVNFAAVGAALETSGDLFTAGIAADVIVTAIWMATCLTVPILFGAPRGDASPAGTAPDITPPAPEADPDALAHRLFASGKSVSMSDLAILAALTLGTLWISDLIAQFTPRIPSVLWLTTIALILAQIPTVKRLTGAAVVGNYLVLLFLASNGARSVIANIVAVGPPIFYFALITVAVHGLVIFGGGRLFRIDMPTLAIASQANVGGPASAMALASARGYADRLLPGVAVGLLGYAFGTYLGLTVASVLQGFIG